METPTLDSKSSTRNANPQQLLYSLMIPGIILPLAGWMLSVSLPVLREEFNIEADTTAWVQTSFSLPFMILMPIYGRLSDGLGKRRLLLFGISVFSIGTFIAYQSENIPMLIVGRVVQGAGIAGTLPLSLALLTEVFSPGERGRAMGVFSTVGPVTGVVGPLLAGFIVSGWGWRTAFLPSLGVALLSILTVYLLIPSSGKPIKLDFVKQFDWIGSILLFATMTSLLFYLASRPITGVASLRDWRLFLAMITFGVFFTIYELQRDNPLIRLSILRTRSLTLGSIAALLRMMLLSGAFGFLMPQYLDNVMGFDPDRAGFYLMLNPAAMVLFVRFGGMWADKFGSRSIGAIGFSILTLVVFWISQLPFPSSYIGQMLHIQTEAMWHLILPLILFGVGAGLMLAALHRAALSDVDDPEIGSASGIYSMIRFLGSALGAAIGGILLQYYEQINPGDAVTAYRSVYLWFTIFGIAGVTVTSLLPGANNLDEEGVVS